MDMRYRLPELMTARGWTAYRVAKETGWAISTSTVQRIASRNGVVGGIDPEVAEALMRAFGLDDDFNRLFALASEPVPKVPRKRKPRPKALA